MNLGAVPALEADVLDRAELELRQQRVIVSGELAQPVAIKRIDFIEHAIVGAQHGGMTGRGG